MDYLDLDLNLTDEDRNIREYSHKFAKDVIQPMPGSSTRWNPTRLLPTVLLYTLSLEKPMSLVFIWAISGGFRRTRLHSPPGADC